MHKNIDILDNLVAIKSISTDIQVCRSLLETIRVQIPSATSLASGDAICWGHTDLATTKWLVNTHIDVVPGKPEQFTLKIHGDKIFGRGTADVKGCASILISQAKNWIELATEKKMTFMLVSDEEVGGASTKALLPLMEDLEGAIFLEPTGLRLTTQAKGMMQVQIIATGISCHGSRPWEGNNAIESISRGLVQFRLAHPTPIQETRDTTFNFSQIKGGEAINQVPSFVELWCDVRFNPKDNPQDIINQLSTCFPGCKIVVVKCESPINCEKSTKIFRSLVDSLKANSTNPLSQFDHGTSDARHATALGIPALVFGPRGGGLHSDNEWVSLKSLDKVSHIIDHWIKNI